MPRKTRKEKIQSQQREKLKLQQTKPSINKINQTNFRSLPRALNEEEQQIKNHFIYDLRQSILIIIFIFTLEIILYFVSMSNYVTKLIR